MRLGTEFVGAGESKFEFALQKFCFRLVTDIPFGILHLLLPYRPPKITALLDIHHDELSFRIGLSRQRSMLRQNQYVHVLRNAADRVHVPC